MLTIEPEAINRDGPLPLKNPLDLHAVEILTDRLRLRPIVLDDLRPLFEEFTHEVARYLIAKPPADISETEAFIRLTTAERDMGLELCFCVFHRETGEHLGACGIHGRRAPWPPEIGLWVKRSAQGQGYGRETVTALVDWAAIYLSCNELLYSVDRANTPSIKIVESLGGQRIGRCQRPKLDGGVLNSVVYRIPLGAS